MRGMNKMRNLFMSEWYMAIAVYESRGNFGPYGNIKVFNDAIIVFFDSPQQISELLQNRDRLSYEVLGIFDNVVEPNKLCMLFKHHCRDAIKGHFERDALQAFREWKESCD